MAKEEDPVCIVGIGCRLPGDIKSPSALWDLLVNKRTTQGPVPPTRFNIKGFYDPDNSRMGAINTDGGYFLNEDVRNFENTFFNINNLEAVSMDPQQRKLLEVVYECLEDAGAADVAGSNTAVYVGNFTIDFQTMQARDPDYIHRYSATGSVTAIMANRISHVFDLHGPSLTLDTACSSSLYGLHQAVVALQKDDCDAAIVAGANLITAPEQHLGTGKGGVLSPTSTCHTFDASADGYGRAEAVNAIYIKRLSSALRDGDRIRAVIRSTAVNANGRTNGITQPSSDFQETVIRKAYARAGLKCADTDYVECHGTGTAVGDPIEVEAIARCFTPRPGPPLKIGSVKTNLGHSEAASGLSSIIKVVAAFENNAIPPTFGIKTMNPKLQLEAHNFKVVTEVEEWPRNVRRASINSFGFGGANAHAILESFESYSDGIGSRLGNEAENVEDCGSEKLVVVPLSGATPSSLEQRHAQILGALSQMPARWTADEISLTMAQRRKVLGHRGYAIVCSRQAMADPDSGSSDLVTSPDASGPSLPIAFVFTGQGAQYAQMAKPLLQHSQIFVQWIRILDGHLQTLPDGVAPGWTLEETILDPPEASCIDHVIRSQPLCTAIQIALCEVLATWGVRATATVGHSSGEIAAAYAAGLLTARQAILAAYLRGYAVDRQTPSSGCMMAVAMAAGEADDMIRQNRLADDVCVACVNSPQSVTLSGTSAGIDMLYEQLQSQKMFARKLKTGGRAYHSHMMKSAGSLYQSLLDDYAPQSSSSPRPEGHRATMYSSVGVDNVFDESLELPSGYWRHNLESSVQFSSALEALIRDMKPHLIEVGPHPALKGPIEQIRTHLGIDRQKLPYNPTLRRGEDADLCIKTLAGLLYNHGHAIDFSAVNGWSRNLQPIHDLPPYPWDYSAGLLWDEPRASIELRGRKHVRHELLGSLGLAQDGVAQRWRNILHPEEVPWLRDHKLESQVVFPAAAFLAMAVEALSQTRDVSAGDVTATFEFRDVNIIRALVVPENGSGAVELHTTLEPKKLSTATSSADWYDFSIGSWSAGQVATHCTGSIRLHGSSAAAMEARAVEVVDTEYYEQWGMSRWYKKLQAKGLCFGPEFQTISAMRTDGNRLRSDAICTTRVLQRKPKAGADASHATYYPIHPLTIDACVQAAILGGTGGEIGKLRAHLPMYIAECRLRSPDAPSVDGEGSIHTQSKDTGPTRKQIHTTLRDARGNAVLDMHEVHLAAYAAKAGFDGPSHKRHPCLRVHWKPDLVRLSQASEASLARYISSRAATESFPAGVSAAMAVLVDLQGHKCPTMNVLELGTPDTRDWYRELLGQDGAFPRCRSWSRGEVNEHGELAIESGGNGPFDLVIIHGLSMSERFGSIVVEQADIIANHGSLICNASSAVRKQLAAANLSVIEAGEDVFLAMPTKRDSPLRGKVATLLVRDRPPRLEPFIESLATFLTLEMAMARADIVRLDEVMAIPADANRVCISLLEMEQPFLANMSQGEMNQLRHMAFSVDDIIFLTMSGLGTSGVTSNPNSSLVHGLSRALMLEQPSLRFSVLDVDTKALHGQHDICSTHRSVTDALVSQYDTDDTEFVERDGLLNVARFTPDGDLNANFRDRIDASTRPVTKRLEDARPAHLATDESGLVDLLHFAEVREPPSELEAGFADVAVQAIGLNAKDVYTLSGRVETPNSATAHEFAGIVRRVGPGVRHVAPGDRVVAMAPDRFATDIQIPAWACRRLLDGEDPAAIVALPVAYCTALYALDDRARLAPGETVLIHAGAGTFGTAAIRVAQRRGAVVYTTASSQRKRRFLARLGVPPAHIFQSRDASFVDDVLAATAGRGVDVVVNSLAGELLHESWRCVAEYGRFVEVGKRELVDAGRLDMAIFLRNATFTAFDLSSLYFHENQAIRGILGRKLDQVLELYRAGEIEPTDISRFDAADVAEAYRHFLHQDRIGKVVITMTNPESMVPASHLPSYTIMPLLTRKPQIRLSKYQTTFDAAKVYLLVGCLGGLGRSLSRWMVARGARRFVFLGRSGCDKPSAKQLVARLKATSPDVQISVVRGDVTQAADVRAAVRTGHRMGPLGGVVHAAMALEEGLFHSMTSAAWHTVVQPKLAGGWNLHNALAESGCDGELDFFLVTSSVSGTVGTATESNYCAANSFLDAFAQWRRQQGKPAVSVGLGMISEVGYLHENPEIEALLLRKGIQPLNEDEFLQVLDLAITEDMRMERAEGRLQEHAAAAHFLTGLEPSGLRRLMAQGFEVDNGTLQDPRAAILAAALTADQDGSPDSQRASSVAHVPWLKSIAAGPAKALLSEADAGSLPAAVLRLVSKRFSSLVLMPLGRIDTDKPLAGFGMDSIIAAEFRTWFWNTFKVDVPFLDLLSQSKNLNDLADAVGRGLRGEGEDAG